jgi:holo-[acyl-carrier protein] synthase
MSMRIGADITAVDDVSASLEHFGDRYLRRVFTEHEVASCTGGPAAFAASLAARFAAKEATIKVLRPTGTTPPWRSIEVHRHPSGWCDLRLHGEAARQAAEQGITELAVSLSHESGIAAAVVLARCGST